MTTGVELHPEVEQALADAVDRIVAAWVEAEVADAGHDGRGVLETYINEQEGMTAILEAGGLPELAEASRRMVGHLRALAQGGGAVAGEISTVLENWPYTLLACCTAPDDEQAWADLLACLDHGAWPSATVLEPVADTENISTGTPEASVFPDAALTGDSLASDGEDDFPVLTERESDALMPGAAGMATASGAGDGTIDPEGPDEVDAILEVEAIAEEGMGETGEAVSWSEVSGVGGGACEAIEGGEALEDGVFSETPLGNAPVLPADDPAVGRGDDAGAVPEEASGAVWTDGVSAGLTDDLAHEGSAGGAEEASPDSLSLRLLALGERAATEELETVGELAGRLQLAWGQCLVEGPDGALAAAVRQVLDALDQALDTPFNPALAEQVVALLAQPLWPEPLAEEEQELIGEMLQADMLLCAPPPSDEGEAAVGLGDPLADPIADAAIPAFTPEAAPVSVGGETTSEPSSGQEAAESDETWCREQVVSGDFLALLAAEVASAAESFAASALEGPDGVEACVDELTRMAQAAEAVGLSALAWGLQGVCRGHMALAEPSPETLAALLGELSPVIQAYLAAPIEAGAVAPLVAWLGDARWASPLAGEAAERLSHGLAWVRVTHEAPAKPVRPVEAVAADVSLALPDDIPQELLESLLLELPVQTEEFSSSIQLVVGGKGALGDVAVAKRAAHTLKGAANTVGLRGIANLTHHLEDILVALTENGILPGHALGDMLVRAADCLEAMSEAVIGDGPEPEERLAVLQEVLNWANRIDQEGIPADDEAPPPVAVSAAPAPASTAETAKESAGAAVAAGPMVRVPASLIDELLRLVGESLITTGQIRDRLGKVSLHNRAVRDQAGRFLRLTGELEELVDIGRPASGTRSDGALKEFDPLEFEHFSALHSVSRRLIESATDARDMELGVEDDLGELGELVESQERLYKQTQAVVMQTRMVRVSTVLSRLQRGVRQACRLLDKEVELEVVGGDTLIDGNILNDLIDPLMHVLRNAVDHGIEDAESRQAQGKPAVGHIRLSFSREGNLLVVRCRDDGSGLDFEAIRRTALARGVLAPDQSASDAELSRLILAPGFSTQDEATQVSGRGIGMDIVSSRIHQMRGLLNLHSQAGRGLTVEIALPAALISTHALTLRAGGEIITVSSHGVQDIHYVLPDQVQLLAGQPTYRIGDNQLAVIELETVLGLPLDRRSEQRGGFPLVIIRLDSGELRALKVQELLQSRDIVVKPLGRYVPKIPGIIGATILGDGSVAPVVDLPEMLGSAEHHERRPVTTGRAGPQAERGEPSRLNALVVDDSLSARRATAQFMKDAGYNVRTAIDGLDAVAILDKWLPDVMLVDMEMPGMNGLELAAHIRASAEPLARVPIIMITSRSTTKHRQQATAAGVDVYLTKPFADEELMDHLLRLAPA